MGIPLRFWYHDYRSIGFSYVVGAIATIMNYYNIPLLVFSAIGAFSSPQGYFDILMIVNDNPFYPENERTFTLILPRRLVFSFLPIFQTVWPDTITPYVETHPR